MPMDHKSSITIIIALLGAVALFFFLRIETQEPDRVTNKPQIDSNVADAYCEKAWAYCVSGNSYGISKQLPTADQCEKLRNYSSPSGAKLSGECPLPNFNETINVTAHQ